MSGHKHAGGEACVEVSKGLLHAYRLHGSSNLPNRADESSSRYGSFLVIVMG